MTVATPTNKVKTNQPESPNGEQLLPLPILDQAEEIEIQAEAEHSKSSKK